MEYGTQKSYMNSYIAGIGLGLVLLATFVIAGRGLGASGALTRLTSYSVDKIAPSAAQNTTYLKRYLGKTTHTLDNFLVYMFIGAFIGGMISGAFGNRIRFEVLRGPNTTDKKRLWLAFAGGIVSALGARLARGCTSGQALSGGATLAVGSWLFMIAVFAGGFAIAYFLRREWK